MRVMAFDFGMKNIGVAVGQTITLTAEPIIVLKATDGIPNWDQIANLIKEWEPVALVVGIPIDTEGKSHLITQCAQKFARRLKEWYKLPVFEADERYTSKSAKSFLSDRGRAKLDPKLDAIAAAIILEAWLQENLNLLPD